MNIKQQITGDPGVKRLRQIQEFGPMVTHIHKRIQHLKEPLQHLKEVLERE